MSTTPTATPSSTFTLGFLLTVALTFLGCASNASSGGGEAPPPFAELAGGEWRLSELAGEPAPAEPVATLAVQDDGGELGIGGSAGCNRYSATVTSGAPGELEIGPVAATKKLCPPPAMEIEDRFVAQLSRVVGYRLVDDDLVLLLAAEDDGAAGESGGSSAGLRFARVEP